MKKLSKTLSVDDRKKLYGEYVSKRNSKKRNGFEVFLRGRLNKK